MNILDAIGLGAFTVIGIDTGVEAGYGDYHFLIIFLGVITGIGGGILRDIMAGETPYVLKKAYLCLRFHCRSLPVCSAASGNPFGLRHDRQRAAGCGNPHSGKPFQVGFAGN